MHLGRTEEESDPRPSHQGRDFYHPNRYNISKFRCPTENISCVRDRQIQNETKTHKVILLQGICRKKKISTTNLDYPNFQVDCLIFTQSFGVVYET